MLSVFYLDASVSNSSSGLTLGLVTFSLIPVPCVTRPRLAQTSGLVPDFCIYASVNPHPGLIPSYIFLSISTGKTLR